MKALKLLLCTLLLACFASCNSGDSKDKDSKDKSAYDAKLSEKLANKLLEDEDLSDKEWGQVIDQWLAIYVEGNELADRYIKEGKTFDEFTENEKVVEMNEYVTLFESVLREAYEWEMLSEKNSKKYENTLKKVKKYGDIIDKFKEANLYAAPGVDSDALYEEILKGKTDFSSEEIDAILDEMPLLINEFLSKTRECNYNSDYIITDPTYSSLYKKFSTFFETLVNNQRLFTSDQEDRFINVMKRLDEFHQEIERMSYQQTTEGEEATVVEVPASPEATATPVAVTPEEAPVEDYYYYDY